MHKLLLTILTATTLSLNAQTTDSISTLSLLFMGDIMGHDTQINSARQADGSFNYTEVFEYLKEDISDVDVAIANLEVTLAGPPFKGYPQFSSPDALAVAVQDAGIDILGTANNHSVDRGRSGIIRTINVLDSLNIDHFGTYLNYEEKQKQTPFIIEKNGFKIAMINYTYGTNGIPVPKPTVVNINNYDSLASDIAKAKTYNPDKIIVYIHWGTEYQHHPSAQQKDLGTFCFNKGADIVIGSHPHVIQKSVWQTDSIKPERFITYSLGNFVSNQRKQYTDGGQMVKLVLEKNNKGVKIKESGYLLTWVYTPIVNGKKHFHILPCAKFELQSDFFVSKEHYEKMKLFISDSRNLMNTENHAVREYIYYNGMWEQ